MLRSPARTVPLWTNITLWMNELEDGKEFPEARSITALGRSVTIADPACTLIIKGVRYGFVKCATVFVPQPVKIFWSMVAEEVRFGIRGTTDGWLGFGLAGDSSLRMKGRSV